MFIHSLEVFSSHSTVTFSLCDGYCDDENNNANCEYDGGDCCGDNVDTIYCTQCQCLDPDFWITTPQLTMQSSNAQSTSNLSCVYPNYQGDGAWDDENNV